MEIYIIRHGQTVWNIDRRLQGRSDIELTEEGRKMAFESGQVLKSTHFDRIYSSPLKRAYETAVLFSGGRDIPIIKDDRLLELCFGEYEGRLAGEMEKDESCSFRYFFSNPELYTPGKGGETLDELCERAADFLINEIEPLSSTCERVMIVAHGAMNKALLRYIKKNPIEDFWAGALQKNCGVTIAEYKNGEYKILEESKIFYKMQ